VPDGILAPLFVGLSVDRTRIQSAIKQTRRGEAMTYELGQVEGYFQIEGSAVNVLVVDDPPLNGQLLRNILAGSKPNGDVVETPSSSRNGFSACADVRDPYATISIGRNQPCATHALQKHQQLDPHIT
jgi:hypothetical protein